MQLEFVEWLGLWTEDNCDGNRKVAVGMGDDGDDGDERKDLIVGKFHCNDNEWMVPDDSREKEEKRAHVRDTVMEKFE